MENQQKQNPIKSWIDLFVNEPTDDGKSNANVLEQVKNFTMARIAYKDLQSTFNTPVRVVVCCESLEGEYMVLSEINFN